MREYEVSLKQPDTRLFCAREIVSEMREAKTRGGRVTWGKACDGRNRFDSNFVRTCINMYVYKYIHAYR